MTAMHKGIAVALAHLAIVSSLGAKLLIDRATQPRVWAQVQPYDPDLPIRGRYLSLRLVVDMPVTNVQCNPYSWSNGQQAKLVVRDGKLTAVADSSGSAIVETPCTPTTPNPAPRRVVNVPILSEPIPYFIPEHANDPTRRPAGEELWAEVTIPKKGPPRPIQLGIKKDGKITPLDLH